MKNFYQEILSMIWLLILLHVLTFGGPDLKDLYVTSALDSEGKGGQLFVIRNTGAQGLAGRSFDPTIV